MLTKDAFPNINAARKLADSTRAHSDQGAHDHGPAPAAFACASACHVLNARYWRKIASEADSESARAASRYGSYISDEPDDIARRKPKMESSIAFSSMIDALEQDAHALDIARVIPSELASFPLWPHGTPSWIPSMRVSAPAALAEWHGSLSAGDVTDDMIESLIRKRLIPLGPVIQDVGHGGVDMIGTKEEHSWRFRHVRYTVVADRVAAPLSR